MQLETSFNKTIGLVIALAGALALGRSTAYAETEDNMEKSFSIGAGGKVVLDVNVGSIEVKGEDRNDVNVHVYRKATARGLFNANAKERETAELKANEVTFSQEGKSAIVKARRPKEADQATRNQVNLQVRYVVSVPKQFEADLKTSGGHIQVQDLTGELKANTSGGGLKFSSIRGPINAHTSGGGIEMAQTDGLASIKTSGGGIKVKQHKGDLTAHTSGGSINVDQVSGKIDASTSGGSVNAALASAPAGDCRLESSGGSISISLPETAAVDLDAKTSGGSVNSELPVKIVGEKHRSSLKGKINNGGKAVYLRTSGGNIQVKKA